MNVSVVYGKHNVLEGEVAVRVRGDEHFYEEPQVEDENSMREQIGEDVHFKAELRVEDEDFIDAQIMQDESKHVSSVAS